MTSAGPESLSSQSEIHLLPVGILGRDLSHAGVKSFYWSRKIFNRCPLTAVCQGQILIATSLAQLGRIQINIFVHFHP